MPSTFPAPSNQPSRECRCLQAASTPRLSLQGASPALQEDPYPQELTQPGLHWVDDMREAVCGQVVAGGHWVKAGVHP